MASFLYLRTQVWGLPSPFSGSKRIFEISFAVDALMSFVYIRKVTTACDHSLLQIKHEIFGSRVKLDASFFDVAQFDEATSIVDVGS
jgi:hypothetical protein